MAARATLIVAAQNAYDDVFTKFGAANALVLAFSQYLADVLAAFPDDGSAATRTVSNWLVPGFEVKETMQGGIESLRVFNNVAQVVYRLSYAAYYAQLANRITAAQAAAVLAAYNDNF